MYKHFLIFLILVACHSKHSTVPQSISERFVFDTPFIDKHVHIMSPLLIHQWKEQGIPFSRTDAYYSDIDTIMKVNNASSISLISMAYTYSSTWFTNNAEEVPDLIRLENDYLYQAKSKYPDKIQAYFGIDPLHEEAMEEIIRCHKALQMDGIKLHFNASQVYLTEATHRKLVHDIFRYASEHKLPILLHFDNSHRKFGVPDIDILADSILANLNEISLQIAHFGTSGGFNPKTREILNHFIELFESDHPISNHNITFDISAVCLDKDADGAQKLDANQWDELALFCRRLGFEKIEFGTDYPLYTSDEYLNVLVNKLNFTYEELDNLLHKTADK